MHLRFDHFRRRVPGFRLEPGFPTTPERHRLPLLPSGPDGVHGFPPRGTRLSTPEARDRGPERRTSWRD